MSLKDTIKSLCKSNGISMNKLEGELGFAKGYISKLEKSTPNSAKLQKIADYFGVTLDYLMGNDSSNVHTTNNNIKVVDENDNVIVLDDEALEIIDTLRTKPEMKILFSVSKKASKEDIIKAVKIIEALKEEGE